MWLSEVSCRSSVGIGTLAGMFLATLAFLLKFGKHFRGCGKTLEVMDVEHTSKDGSVPYEDSWESFPSDKYVALRSLTLHLEHAHGWDGSRLHTMLKGLAQLRSLKLWFPTCCGLERFALSGTYPHLRSFAICSVQLEDIVADGEPSTRTFLSRYPHLEHLSISYMTNVYRPVAMGCFELQAGDLPSLRALDINIWSLHLLPDLATKLSCDKLEALKVDFVPHVDWMPLKSCLTTLRYLDITCNRLLWSPQQPLKDKAVEESAQIEPGKDQIGTRPDSLELENDSANKSVTNPDPDERNSGPDDEVGLISTNEVRDPWSYVARPREEPGTAIVTLLKSLPSLTELRFRIDSWPQRETHPDPDTDLTYFFSLVTPEITPCLTAVTFVDQNAQQMPSPEILADLACTLPALQYLGWQAGGGRALYKLERKDDKVVAVVIEPFNRGISEDLWLNDAVLDHFGEAARGW